MRNQTLFEAYLELPPGTHQIEIEAKDFSNNTRTQSYQLQIANEPSAELKFDLNGNLTHRITPTGTITYERDALDRLITIIYPDTSRSEFTYDGLSRLVRIIEKDAAGTITTDKRHLWDDLTIAEERASDGTNINKRFYPQGVELVTGPCIGTYTYRTDHLGSIREVVNSTGALVARYDYSAWGEWELISGTFDLDFRYTGHYYHQPSGLHLAPFRAYDAGLGRWINRDPIKEAGGLNLYGYVLGNPINAWDLLGLDICLMTYDGNHAGVIITDPTSKSGYSEYHYTPASGLGWDDPIGAIFAKGLMTKLEGGKPIDSNNVTRLETTPDQDKRARDYAEKLAKDGGTYTAAGNNCAHASRDVIEAGIGIPIKGPNPVTPNSLKRDLEFMKRWKAQYPFKP
jgi:RHS repeat-associated protein